MKDCSESERYKKGLEKLLLLVELAEYTKVK
jgi:hypothetical protein